jgi:hypothetical protein
MTRIMNDRNQRNGITLHSWLRSLAAIESVTPSHEYTVIPFLYLMSFIIPVISHS